MQYNMRNIVAIMLIVFLLSIETDGLSRKAKTMRRKHRHQHKSDGLPTSTGGKPISLQTWLEKVGTLSIVGVSFVSMPASPIFVAQLTQKQLNKMGNQLLAENAGNPEHWGMYLHCRVRLHPDNPIEQKVILPVEHNLNIDAYASVSDYKLSHPSAMEFTGIIPVQGEKIVLQAFAELFQSHPTIQEYDASKGNCQDFVRLMALASGVPEAKLPQRQPSDVYDRLLSNGQKTFAAALLKLSHKTGSTPEIITETIHDVLERGYDAFD